jgi:hypothetical protein
VRLLLRRFPDLRTVPLRLPDADASFTELCEDYEACAQALAYLARHESNAAMYGEFRVLRLHLEGELLRYLAASSDDCETH